MKKLPDDLKGKKYIKKFIEAILKISLFFGFDISKFIILKKIIVKNNNNIKSPIKPVVTNTSK